MSYGGDYGDERARRLPAQTRTRLPEDDEPSARPPSSPRRSLITIVGVTVLLLGAIVFANQQDGGDGEGESKESGGAGRAGATAPTGERPVEETVNGVPSGFARTEQGAQSAAANYAVFLGGEEMFDPERRQEIVHAVYAPDVAAERAASLDSAYGDPEFLASIGLAEDGTPPEGTDFVSRVVPVGTSVVEFSETDATVDVWYTSLIGLAGEESTRPVTESWYTHTFELVWAGGEWKVTRHSQVEGPAPVGRDQMASTWEEMADAAERFGGFTYAR